MAQPLSKDIGKPIDADLAKKWIKNFETKNPGAIKAVFFGADILNSILAQGPSVGIRIYNAIDDTGNSTLVIVGANANGNNVWPSTKGENYPDGIVGDWGLPCPISCNDN